MLERAWLAVCYVLAGVASLVWLTLSHAQAAPQFPPLTGRVVDDAGVLSDGAKRELNGILAGDEEKFGGRQVVVAALKSLQGYEISDYGYQLGRAWGIGQKGKDNGVLVVVVPNDRKMRIEVGYGLEGTLPDVAAARIIRNVMTPAFKASDYDKGVSEGVAAIIAQLEGRGDAAGTPTSLVDTGASSGGEKASFKLEGPELPWYMRILLGCFIFGIIGLFTVVGVMTPGVGWFLYAFLIPFWAMFPIIIIGPKATAGLLALYVIGYPVAKLWFARQPWYAKAAAELKTKGTATIGGMVITSGGSIT
jgi:uncharacterized protein